MDDVGEDYFGIICLDRQSADALITTILKHHPKLKICTQEGYGEGRAVEVTGEIVWERFNQENFNKWLVDGGHANDSYDSLEYDAEYQAEARKRFHTGVDEYGDEMPHWIAGDD